MIGHMLDIDQAKQGDIVGYLYENPGTPSDPVLNVFKMDGTPVEVDIVPDSYDVNYFYWFYDTAGLTRQQNYRLEIDDVTPYPSEEFLLYITQDNEAEVETALAKAKGLAGHNRRFFNFIYLKGSLASFQVRVYANQAALELAKSGGADVFLYSYTFTVSYDSSYNIDTITSVED